MSLDADARGASRVVVVEVVHHAAIGCGWSRRLPWRTSMNLELSQEAAEVLLETLNGVLGDVSSEIANTDNASYRAGLMARRDLLREVQTQLEQP
jgi:hypothetical protein